MAAILKIIGWVATAIGVVFLFLPLVVSAGLSADAMVQTGIFLLVTGPLMVGLSHLIEVAEKIQANTNWLSSGSASIVAAAEPEPVEPAVAPAPEPEPEPAPEPVEEQPAAAPPPPPLPPEKPVPRSERRPQASAPQLYDANVHPAAVDEWDHNGRRVMTLEDGSLATEVDGAWYRFLKIEEIDALQR